MNSGVNENLETKTEDIEITIENIEYSKREYSCPICKKTYKGRQTLINHNDNQTPVSSYVQTGEKPYAQGT